MEIHYAPIPGSWLNAVIELSVLIRKRARVEFMMEEDLCSATRECPSPIGARTFLLWPDILRDGVLTGT